MKKALKSLSLVALLASIVACNKAPTEEQASQQQSTSQKESSSQQSSTNQSSTEVSTSSTPEESSSSEQPKEFDVYVVDSLPNVKPYKDFDVSTVIVPFEGATYTYEGTYLDGRSREKEITFTGSVMNVPQDGTVAEITVTATREGVTKTKDISLGVNGVADVMDNGISQCWAEDSIARAINFNPEYIKDGDSSVKVTFSGFYNSIGTQFSCINSHLSNNDEKGIYDTDYLTINKEANTAEELAAAYEDAYLCFWVYNAMKAQEVGVDDSLTIGIRIKESPVPYEGTEHTPVDMDWSYGTGAKLVTAPRGEWTLVYWSLKDMGKTTDFYKNMDIYYEANLSNETFRNSYDAIALKVQGKNVAKVGDKYDETAKYSYSFYFDGYDIMSKASFEAKFADYLAEHQGK